MKNLMNFYAPMWLLVLGFALFSCDSEDITASDEEPIFYTNRGGIAFAIVDREYNNLFKDEQNSIYDMDYIHIVTADGKYRDNLRKQYIEHYHIPYYEGYTFVSTLLSQISASGSHDKDHIKPEYANKPLYLHLSSTDIDTLVWNGNEKKLYHNGKATNNNAIVKDLKK
ncbi:hypothetical protein ACE193_03290 [Bernardetia sp. OM2101]|uniref:hypothetical protein n=1 Tax=Bernardetia sp. OM2101 TaxID=3344876 RepID=UPI0035CF1FDC